MIAVQNSGEPIHSNDLPHIIDRLYRVEKSLVRQTGGERSWVMPLLWPSETLKLHTIRIKILDTSNIIYYRVSTHPFLLS